MVGMPFEGDLDEVAGALEIDLSDVAAIAAFEARWRAIEPEVEAVRVAVGQGSDHVEEVFQRLVDEDPDVFDPEVLASRPAATRMLIATRVIEGQVDNGGWAAVFYNAADDLLSAAIEGYRLLGLEDHASLAERIRAHGTEPTDDWPDDPAWVMYDAEWFGLPDSEVARAEYIRAHPAEFQSGGL
jgi:hypothetical protein